MCFDSFCYCSSRLMAPSIRRSKCSLKLGAKICVIQRKKRDHNGFVSFELSLSFLGHFCFYKFSGRVDLKPLGSCNFPTCNTRNIHKPVFFWHFYWSHLLLLSWQQWYYREYYSSLVCSAAGGNKVDLVVMRKRKGSGVWVRKSKVEIHGAKSHSSSNIFYPLHP